MKAELITAPAAEPVTLAEAKEWLRVDGADEDAAISRLVASAREALERATGRLMATQTWRLSLDAWPAPTGDLTVMALPLAPVQTIAAVRVFDHAGAAQTIAAAAYQLVGPADAARLLFKSAPAAPGRAVGGIEIECVAGYGAPSAVPASLRQAVVELVAQWFQQRGDATDARALPETVRALIAPYRRARLI